MVLPSLTSPLRDVYVVVVRVLVTFNAKWAQGERQGYNLLRYVARSSWHRHARKQADKEPCFRVLACPSAKSRLGRHVSTFPSILATLLPSILAHERYSVLPAISDYPLDIRPF